VSDISPDGPGFKLLVSALEDARRLIAAGKVQRWDVMKWSVGLNFIVAGVVRAGHTEVGNDLVGLVIFVAATSCWLLYYYNRRVEGARKTADRVEHALDELDAVAAKIIGRDKASAIARDRSEAIVLGVIVFMSGLLSAYVMRS
jgi:hypothetical protein